jgi:hypothetical protein
MSEVPLAIVVALDVGKYHRPGRLSAGEALPMEKLHLQTCHKALGDDVVQIRFSTVPMEFSV